MQGGDIDVDVYHHQRYEATEIDCLVTIMKQSVGSTWRDQVDVLLRDWVKEKIQILLKSKGSHVLSADFVYTPNFKEIVELLEDITFCICSTFYEYYNNFVSDHLDAVIRFALICKKAKRFTEENWRDDVKAEDRILMKKIIFKILKHEVAMKQMDTSDDDLKTIVTEIENVFFLQVSKTYLDYCDYKRLRFNINQAIILWDKDIVLG